MKVVRWQGFQPYEPAAFTPQGIPRLLISSAASENKLIKNANDLIEKTTRYLRLAMHRLKKNFTFAQKFLTFQFHAFILKTNISFLFSKVRLQT